MAGILSRKAAATQVHNSVCKQVPHANAPQGCLLRRTAVVARGWDSPQSAQGERAMFGEDFGARDPYAGEVESNFGEKTLGNFDTEHVIKIPNMMKSFIGLTSRSCSPEGAQAKIESEKEINLLKNQLAGWKVVTGKSGHPTLRYDWRTIGPESAVELQGMITDLAKAEGHAAALVEASGEFLILELSTAAVQGLSENDFILAAKVNEIDAKPLLAPPRKRLGTNWA